MSPKTLEFAKNVKEQTPDFFMASFDIESLFTKCPVGRNNGPVCQNNLLYEKKVQRFSKDELKQLLCLAVKDSFFLFNDTYYE